MAFKKFSQVSRNKDINYNLQTKPVTIGVSNMNVLEITAERVNDTVFTLYNTALAALTYTADEFGSFTDLIGLAVDPLSGNIFIGDENVIRVFDSTGSSLFTFGGTGTEDGEFQSLMRIRIFNGRVFAADNNRGIIQVFELDGTYITQFGNTRLSQPTDIAKDSRDNYYVLDEDFEKVFIYDRSFLFKRTILSGLTNSISLAINSRDIIYMVNSTNDNFHIFKTNGELIATLGTSGSGDLQFDNPLHVSIQNNDDVFISDTSNDRIQVVNKDGAFLYDISGSFGVVIGLDFNPIDDTIVFIDGTNIDVDTLSVNTTSSDSIEYKVYGSSNTLTAFDDPTNPQWVNLLSIRDIEEGGSSTYNHDFIISIPINARTYESFSNSWKQVLVQASTAADNSTLATYSRGQSS